MKRKYDDFCESLVFSNRILENWSQFNEKLFEFQKITELLIDKKNKYCSLPFHLQMFINSFNILNFESLFFFLNFKKKSFFSFFFGFDFFCLFEYGLYMIVQPTLVTLSFLDVTLYDKITETDTHKGFELIKFVEFYFFSNIYEKIFLHPPYK